MQLPWSLGTPIPQRTLKRWGTKVPYAAAADLLAGIGEFGRRLPLPCIFPNPIFGAQTLAMQ
jgi:hypothetical protein